MFRTERSSPAFALALVAGLALSAGGLSASASASASTTALHATPKLCKHRHTRRHGHRATCHKPSAAIPTPHPAGDAATPPRARATTPKPSAFARLTSRPGQLAARTASSPYDLALPYPSFQIYYFRQCGSWAWSYTYRVWFYVCAWDNGLGYPFQHRYFRVFYNANGVTRYWFEIYDTPPVFS
jgi:hypothetical protein